jgi:protein-disulfide isomerase
MSTLTVPDPARDHISGFVDGSIRLLEYGDYECPFCGEAQPIVEEIQRRLGDDLCFAFRHFPLTRIHPHSEHAAEAAESAGSSGNFWEMHNICSPIKVRWRMRISRRMRAHWVSMKRD